MLGNKKLPAVTITGDYGDFASQVAHKYWAEQLDSAALESVIRVAIKRAADICYEVGCGCLGSGHEDGCVVGTIQERIRALGMPYSEEDEPKQESNRMFKIYQTIVKKAEMRPYVPGDDLTGVSISQADKDAGSPKLGDMIRRNPDNHADQWLVNAKYFSDNFEQ